MISGGSSLRTMSVGQSSDAMNNDFSGRVMTPAMDGGFVAVGVTANRV